MGFIDDYIPCKPRKWYEEDAEPIFSKPVGNELWVLFLEKAFAKYFGGYNNLDANNPCLAWQSITGAAEQVMYKKKGKGWKKCVADIEGQRSHWKEKSRHDISFKSSSSDAELKADELWANLLEASEKQHYLMGCSIDSDTSEALLANGLVATHVYSILRACVAGKKKYKFVELRNPWGNSVEWNGAWGDHDPAWKQNPELAKELDMKEADDGTFWMLLDDFLREFTNVFLCPSKQGGAVSMSAPGDHSDDGSGSEAWEDDTKDEHQKSSSFADIQATQREQAKRPDPGNPQAFD